METTVDDGPLDDRPPGLAQLETGLSDLDCGRVFAGRAATGTRIPFSHARLRAQSPQIDPETGDEAGVGSPCVETGVTIGYDSSAHAASTVDVASFLTEQLAPS